MAEAARENESPSEHADRTRATDRRSAASGERLPSSTAAFFGARYGHDFSSVRVHTDARSATQAQGLHAHAFTVGQDVHFAPGRYNPHSADGQRLIAHELAHVVQQHGRPATGTSPDRSGERAAEAAAAQAIAGRPTRIQTIATGGPQLQVDPRHARGFAGEQGMGFVQYSQKDGWIFVEGPSGAGGHGVTQSGFDGVAYNTRTGEVHLIDNKSLARAGNVSSATAIDPAKNLGKNLDDLIGRVSSAKDVPGRMKLLERLKALKAALAAGKPPPAGIKLVVTAQGGSSTGVSPALQGRGVEFRPESPPKAASTPSPAPAATSPAAAPAQSAAAPAPTVTAAPAKTATPGPSPEGPATTSAPGPRATTGSKPPANWKGGLKAGGKAAAWMLLFMALDHAVMKQLEHDLEVSLQKAHDGAMPWALRLKRTDPSMPVYMQITVRSSRKQHFVPLLGWILDPPELHMTSIEMVRAPIETRVTEGHPWSLFHAEDWTEVVYTDLMVE